MTSDTPDNSSRQAALSPAKRALLDRWLKGTSVRQGIPRRTEPGPVAASFAQQRLWFLEQFVPGSPAYAMYDAVRISGPLDPELVARALNLLVARHEALRTTFVAADGQPLQVIAPTLRVLLRQEDFSALPPDRRMAELVQEVIAETRTPFDLREGPLVRATLARLGTEEHILLVCMHHIISDGWSIGIWVRELATLCGELAAGRAVALPPLPIQYADVACWQREQMASQAQQQHLAYWKERLSGDLPILQLPADRPHPAIPSFQGARHRVRLDPELVAGLKSLSQRYDATLFMTLLAAFKVLLFRYTNQTDLCVGTPIANRSHPDLEGLIGMFVNTLVLRTDLGGSPSFCQLLQRVRETALGAYEHQDLPFEKLVEELQPDRDTSHTPLFQVMFVFQNTPMPTLEFAGLTISPLDIHNQTAKFDLLLTVVEDTRELTLGFEYNTDIFDLATVEGLARHFITLLQHIVARPEGQITRLPLLNDEERHDLLVNLNATATPYDLDRCLHTLIEAQVARTPEAPALVYDGQVLSFHELNRRANQLAHTLRAYGVGPETLVGIATERSLEMVIGLLGIIKAGGAYVPLDPSYPPQRLAMMIEDSGVPLLLTQARLAADLPAYQGVMLCLDRDWPTIAAADDTNLVCTVTPDHLAYMIYTSGSTGRPKGAMNTHRAIVNRLIWMQAAYGLGADDRVLQKTPFSFDVSVWEFFWPLLTGATLVIARPNGHQDSAYLVRLIIEQRITTLHFVPSMLQIFLEERGTSSCTSLRRVICSGEALPVDLARRFFTRLGAELHNLYGPTEAAVDVSYWACLPNATDHTIPIGFPIANLQLYVLDPWLQPVPLGVPGELYIAGLGVGRGYVRRPGLTAEKFIPDPFSRQAGTRMYRTGDRTRYRPDGSIEFLGRIDFQVKLRGFRIELGEIETILNQHQLVRESVAMIREDIPGDQRIVAYLVQSQEAAAQQLATLHDEQLGQWALIFDDHYRRPVEHDDNTFNIIGWNSSYTGKPLAEAEMRTWVETTVERILALGPRHMLELGCGTGLLLFRLAPHCERYIGSDLANASVAFIQRQLGQGEEWRHVTVAQHPADDLDWLDDEQPDTVVLNSVVQYFPDLAYLVRVLEAAIKRIPDGGHVFVGDVRSLPLWQTFHTSLELFQAPAALPITQLHQRVQKRQQQDSELVIDPAFFFALQQQLPRISHVAILHKRGAVANELTKFRYDVVLHIGDPRSAQAIPWRTWADERLTLEAVCGLLADEQPPVVGLRRVPNARLAADVAVMKALERDDGLQTSADLVAAAVRYHQEAALDPEQFWACAQALPYTVECRWAGPGAHDYLDVVFVRHDHSSQLPAHCVLPAYNPVAQARAWSAYANFPLREKVAQKLVPELRAYLRDRLPEYMIPASFVLLDAMPLSPNGKVDRRKLPAVELLRPELDSAFVAPETATEQLLAELWSQVLGIQQIGVHDNFFDLGGHSLLATQLLFRMRERLNQELPLQLLFEAPTIARLAPVVDEIVTLGKRPEPPALDLHAEVTLDARISSDGAQPYLPGTPVKQVLLTGATGFLGAFLLQALLEQTEATVTCLVRARDPEHGLVRIRESLSLYGCWHEAYCERIRPLVGDLAEPQLGLAPLAWDTLAREVDAIYHNAAVVNFVYPYAMHKAANVQGTETLIRLACAQRIKPIHYVSTLYVFTPQDVVGGAPLGEDVRPMHGNNLSMGYTQSKWVAEGMLRLAAGRGLPIAIYRPGRIAGDSRSGACQTEDFLWRLVQTCITFRIAPALDFIVDIVPVDYVSRAIVRLAADPAAPGQAFHLFNPRPMTWQQLLAHLEQLGYRFRHLPPDVWRAELIAAIAQATNNEGKAIMPFMFAQTDDQLAALTFDQGNAAAVLGTAGIVCPAVDPELINTYIAYFVRTGFMPDQSRN